MITENAINDKKDFQLIVITGLSGGGKTRAVRYLEDLGYFCVDNFLPAFIVPFVDLISSKFKKVALVVDARGGAFFAELSGSLHQLKEKGWLYKLLFLDASDEMLVARFSETRRRHPLMKEEMTLLESINKERCLLREIHDQSDNIINTSNLAPEQLKKRITTLFVEHEVRDASMIISIISFGYRYGIPMDADLVFDVRFLPNPHYIDALRELNGLNKEVQDFVLGKSVTQEFLKKFSGFISYLVPHYQKEGKSSLTVAIGCTGGRHRSVAISHELCKYLQNLNSHIIERHRDLEKDEARYKQKDPL